MRNGFSRLAAALFGHKTLELPEDPAVPPRQVRQTKLPLKEAESKAPEVPVIRFWDEPDPPYCITLTDVQAVERNFRHAIDRSLLIGLSAEMDICVNHDRSVSRRHCEILRDGDRFYLVNHSHSNGTLLNRQVVIEKTPVRDGDVITMGRVELRLEIDG